jgi:acyl carrier protein
MSSSPLLTTEQLVGTIRDVLLERRPPPVDVSASDTIAVLGLDSLDLAEVLMTLEDLAGADIDREPLTSPGITDLPLSELIDLMRARDA